jgi:hypothetical protein
MELSKAQTLWEGVGFFNEGSPGPVLKIRLSQRT